MHRDPLALAQAAGRLHGKFVEQLHLVPVTQQCSAPVPHSVHALQALPRQGCAWATKLTKGALTEHAPSITARRLLSLSTQPRLAVSALSLTTQKAAPPLRLRAGVAACRRC